VSFRSSIALVPASRRLGWGRAAIPPPAAISHRAAFAVLAAVVVAGAGPAAVAAAPPTPDPGIPVRNGTTLIVTAQDNGSTVVMRRNETLRVVLRSNSGTGYSWDIERLDGSRMVPLGQESRTTPGAPLPDGRALPMAGAPQQVSFLFRMAQPGKSELVLRLWRPWEGPASAAERFRLRVVTVLP